MASESSAPPVVAAVTAYNEESTVGAIVRVLRSCPSVGRVRVVDDGSTDATAAVARESGAEVISLPTRIPVGQAIMHHLEDLETDAVLVWCDADLLDLQPAYIEHLIARFRGEGVTQSLSSRGLPRSWPAWLRNGLTRTLWTHAFGPLSGERVIRRTDFVRAIDLAGRLGWKEMMRGYGIVLFLNYYSSRFGRGNVISYFDGLAQRQKYEKWGQHSTWEMVAEWAEFVRTWLKIRLHAPLIARRMGELDGEKLAPNGVSLTGESAEEPG